MFTGGVYTTVTTSTHTHTSTLFYTTSSSSNALLPNTPTHEYMPYILLLFSLSPIPVCSLYHFFLLLFTLHYSKQQQTETTHTQNHLHLFRFVSPLFRFSSFLLPRLSICASTKAILKIMSLLLVGYLSCDLIIPICGSVNIGLL